MRMVHQRNELSEFEKYVMYVIKKEVEVLSSSEEFFEHGETIDANSVISNYFQNTIPINDMVVAFTNDEKLDYYYVSDFIWADDIENDIPIQIIFSKYFDDIIETIFEYLDNYRHYGDKDVFLDSSLSQNRMEIMTEMAFQLSLLRLIEIGAFNNIEGIDIV